MKKFAIFLLLSLMTLGTPLTSYAATVMIDPGHGGADPGAIGITGLYEKEVNLAISLMVKDELEKKGYRVFMTRDQDVSLSLQERIALANELMPDILVSIHANSFRKPDVSGTLVLYYDHRYPVPNYPASEAMARLSPQSRELAVAILEEAVNATGSESRGLLESSVYMVRMGSVPSALIETAFLSNREDEEKLRDDEFRYQMAVGIANGIARYLPVLFSDTLGHWARESILKLQELGIVQGNGEYYFPERSLTRAEFIAMVERSGILDGSLVDDSLEEEEESDELPGDDEELVEEEDPEDSTDERNTQKSKNRERQSRVESQDNIMQDEQLDAEELDDGELDDGQGKSSEIEQDDREANINGRQEEEAELDLEDWEEIVVEFSDLNHEHWAYKSMIKAVKHEIITGFPDGTLRPDEPITRAQVSVMLDRLISKYTYTDEEEQQKAKDELAKLKKSFSFHDVPDQIWYADAIYRLYNQNIVVGVGANKFAPERRMSRGEAAALIDRLLAIRL